MYEIISTISQSEKSAVYLATAPEYDEPIIVKVLQDGNTDVIERIAALHVAQIPEILHVETEGSRVTVYEQYIDGKPLDVYVSENQLSEAEIVALVLQVCEGLRSLHRQDPPIIHRDLKPSNLLVTQDGQVHIIDFDASRVYKSEKSNDTHVLGTENYAPPEQYGYSQTDARSDIYALGAVLHELLSEPVAPALKRIIDRCMRFSPDARFADVEALEKALRSYRRGRSGKLWIVVGAAVFVCIAVVGAVLFFKKPSVETPSGEVKEMFFDTHDWKTGENVPWTFYYWLEHPELTPFHVTHTTVTGLTAREIQVQAPRSSYTDTLDPEYWSQDENGFITIEDSYLQTLNEDAVYSFTVDYTSVHLSFQLCCIDDLKKAVHGDPIMNPGFYEYLRTDPGDKTLYTLNTFGRKLLGFEDAETGEKLDPSLYQYDSATGRVVFSEKMFEPVADGVYLAYFMDFESLPEIEDPPAEDRPMVNFVVRDRPYIQPVFDKRDFILQKEPAEDLPIEFEWNDAWGKLEFIECSPQDDETGQGTVQLEEKILRYYGKWHNYTQGVPGYAGIGCV